MLLAGDVGGTNVRIAVFDNRRRLEPIREATFASRDYSSLEAILEAFVDSKTDIDSACFGVAGPVFDGRVTFTNLDWRIEERSLERVLGCRVRLLNDLQASAYGTLELDDDAFRVIQDGAPTRNGTIGVIAAGTGLGEAMLVWDGARYRALPSEGGHVGFAPRSALESDLLAHLQERYGAHVSYERVLSGHGLVDIYEFLRTRSGVAEPTWLTQRLGRADRGATIGAVGVEGSDDVCVEALDTFASIYGAEAGNLALKCFATGGVVVTGGIAPKILPILARGGFVSSFNDKGRFREFTERVPIKIALDSETALIGAAHCAREGID